MPNPPERHDVIHRARTALRTGAWALVLFALVVAPAQAAPKDQVVVKLQQDAVENDYLEMRFPDAIRKFRQAIAICGRTGCARTLVAELHRDLAIMYVGSKKPEEAKTHFAEALRLDPDTAIPKELTSPEVKAAFAEGREEAQRDAKTTDAAAAPEKPRARKPPPKVKEETVDTDCQNDPDCKGGKKGLGSACGIDSDCADGICKNGRCSEDKSANESGGAACETDRQCGPGWACKGGYCAANPKRNWFGIVGQLDVAWMPGATDACLDQTVYACVGNGVWYEPNQMATQPGEKNEVQAGPGLATTRVLLAYDRVVSSNFQLGGRIGYAFGGSPPSRTGTSLIPYHFEARASLWIGSEPFIKTGTRPYLVASLGFAQVDVGTGVEVVHMNPQGMNETLTLSAWKRSGSVFASGGFGFLYALGRNTGFFFEVRAQRMFPSAGTIIPIQMGWVVGL
jgi:hypothetical protein